MGAVRASTRRACGDLVQEINDGHALERPWVSLVMSRNELSHR
jgi:hypothetical protein